jgi:hypothetical protein
MHITKNRNTQVVLLKYSTNRSNPKKKDLQAEVIGMEEVEENGANFIGTEVPCFEAVAGGKNRGPRNGTRGGIA